MYSNLSNYVLNCFWTWFRLWYVLQCFCSYKVFGVPALAETCLWRPLTLACVLNLEVHFTSFKMNKLSFKLFGADFFSIWKKRLCFVCVFSSHSFWTSSSLDVPAGVTQEEGHTGFLIHLLSAVRALIFLARRIQPFLSLVDGEVEFCVLTI